MRHLVSLAPGIFVLEARLEIIVEPLSTDSSGSKGRSQGFKYSEVGRMGVRLQLQGFSFVEGSRFLDCTTRGLPQWIQSDVK